MRIAAFGVLLGLMGSMVACGSSGGEQGDEQDVQETGGDKLDLKAWSGLVGVWERTDVPLAAALSDKGIDRVEFTTGARGADIDESYKGDYEAVVSLHEGDGPTRLPFSIRRVTESSETKCASGAAAHVVEGSLGFNDVTGHRYYVTLTECPKEEPTLKIVFLNAFTKDDMTMEYVPAE